LFINFDPGTVTVTATPSFYATFFTQDGNDSTKTIAQVNWVNLFPALGTKPDARLNSGSVAATGANFTNTKFGNDFLAVTKNEDINVSVYPNPANNTVTINTNMDDEATLEILTLEGKVVKSEVLKSNSTEVNVSDLTNGIYLLNISNSSSRKAIKLIKH